jgi:hypothetical protein
MIRSLGSAGLTLVTLGAGLGLYFVSFSVAQERTRIERYERQIAHDRHDIRALEAELRVRSNLPQLERWNDTALTLKAPRAGQILDNELQLAALVQPGVPADVGVRVQLAAVELPVVAPPADAVASASVDATPDTGLFSAAFGADIDAAAARERAAFTKVALR